MENAGHDYGWDLALDYSSFIDDPNLSWLDHSSGIEIDFSQACSWPQGQESSQKECSRKRVHADDSSKPSNKACREKLRREKLNDSFVDLSSMLEPGRAAKTDKLVILSDAIRVLNELQTEAKEYKDENIKLHEEIESLKAEKNELREEKISLKTEKERMERQLKAMSVPGPGLMAPYSGGYHSVPNKMGLYPSYAMHPMWHYLPQSTLDTSHDHELRPPAA